MTAQDIAQQYQDEYPQQRFAYSADGATVGIYDESRAAFRALTSLTLTGRWYAAPHVLVNGELPTRQWVPCTAVQKTQG